MNKRLFPLVILGFACLFMCNSCKKSGNKEIDPEFARYIAAFTYGKVSSTSDIQIELTQDLPNVELNKEIEGNLFEFSPSIKGKAYWTGTRNIKFVPEPGELKAGQEYDAWFRLDKVLDVESDFKEFYFYFKVPEQNFKVSLLPYSPIKDNDLIWNTVQGSVNLADDAPLENVKQMFSLSGDGAKDAKVKIIPTEVKGRYNIVIDSLRREAQARSYMLKIDGASISAKNTEEISIPIAQTSSTSFEVVDVRMAYDPQECIRITFSDPLSVNQNIQGLVSPNGVDNFSYDIQKNVLRLFLDNYKGGSNINLSIFRELKNFDNTPLDKSYTYSVNF